MDPKRLQVLYELHWKSLLSLAEIQLHNSSDAEDLVQETFLLFMKKSVSHTTSTITLYQIAQMLIRRYNAQNSTVNFGSFDQTFETPDNSEEKTLLWQAYSESLLESSKSQRLKDALTDLPKDDRLILTLFYFENISAKEIGIQTRSSHAAIRKRLERSKKRLRSLYQCNTN